MKRILPFRRRLILITAAVALLTAVGIFAANRACERATEGRIYASLDTVPVNDVGLVLGLPR